MTTYWIWIGPAVDEETINRDLLNMRAAGIGGTVVLPIYPLALDDPSRGIRNLRFLSPEFLDALNYAARRSRELGMTFDLTLGTGWPYGGPSVNSRNAARKITSSEIPMRAGTRTVRLPDLAAGEHLVALFARTAKGMREIELPSPEKPADVALPEGFEGGKLLRFVSTPTGQMVKRAAFGADGPVIDHLDHGALRRYLEDVGEPLWAAVRDAGIRSFWCDSLEVYGSNWTPSLLEKFRARRGYDLKPLLPLLFQAASPESDAVRYDYWRTVSELAEEEFVRPLYEWSHARGKLLRMESYGQPPVSLRSMRYVDLPVGEHYEWRMFNACRWTSSGAWIYGRREVGAEAWTWVGIPNRFGDSLEHLKLTSDMHFLSGVNSFMAVSYVHTPRGGHYPDWTPYWGPAFNHEQTWWPYFPQLSRYVQRAGYLLRQGEPVADIALFLPADDALATAEIGTFPIQGTTGIRFERAATGKAAYIGMNLFFAVRDMLHHSRAPEMGLENAVKGSTPVVETIITNGYSFGGIDSFSLGDMKIEGGRLKSAMTDYRVLVLPGLRGLRLDTLERIAEFCRQGGVVIATRRLPDVAYGYRDREKNTARLRSLVAEMFGTGVGKETYRENRFGAGRAVFAADEKNILLQALKRAMQPDIRFEAADSSISFMHRRTAERDYYFVCNMSPQWKSVRATFRVGRKQPEVWEPMSGETRIAVEYRWQADGTEVPITLEPYGSTFVVFSAAARRALVHRSNVPDLRQSGSSVVGRVEAAGTYFVETSSGRKEKNVRQLPAPLPVNSAWRLTLTGETPLEIPAGPLKSWTEYPEGRYFSGQGTYRTNVHIAKEYLGLRLDLGSVRETAEVYVNGRPAGVAWKRPYVVDITRQVRPGDNDLEIRVTNLVINRVIGGRPPDYRALRERYGERFPDPQEWKVVKEPFPSGLLGPVRLVPYLRVEFKL